ncbi:unnamed protein product, partial [Nesidiocoris tenuis]
GRPGRGRKSRPSTYSGDSLFLWRRTVARSLGLDAFRPCASRSVQIGRHRSQKTSSIISFPSWKCYHLLQAIHANSGDKSWSYYVRITNLPGRRGIGSESRQLQANIFLNSSKILFNFLVPSRLTNMMESSNWPLDLSTHGMSMNWTSYLRESRTSKLELNSLTSTLTDSRKWKFLKSGDVKGVFKMYGHIVQKNGEDHLAIDRASMTPDIGKFEFAMTNDKYPELRLFFIFVIFFCKCSLVARVPTSLLKPTWNVDGPHFKGPTCQKDVDECQRFKNSGLGCQNGAICQNTPGSFSCICADGWYGIHCTKKTHTCQSAGSADLCGHGVCVDQTVGTVANYKCECDQ